jgi:hypothetical protein
VHASSATSASGSAPLLDWEWALRLFGSCRNAWLATVRPDGRPHVAPLWVVVVDRRIWFWTLERTAKGRNLLHDDRAALHVESGDDVAIAEGRAMRTEVTQDVVDAYAAKYESVDLDRAAFWTIEVESGLAWQGHLGSAQVNATRFARSSES